MRLPKAPQSPHKACNDNRGNEKCRERREILRVRHLEGEKRLYEEEVEPSYGNDGKNDRRYEAIHQGQQYDDNQIDARDRRGTQTEKETRPRRERQSYGAR